MIEPVEVFRAPAVINAPKGRFEIWVDEGARNEALDGFSEYTDNLEYAKLRALQLARDHGVPVLVFDLHPEIGDE